MLAPKKRKAVNLKSRWTAAAVVGVAVLSAAPAAHAQGVTNPATNPYPITVTIDGQTYTDGKDTLPGYDDIACTAIPYVSYDFKNNAVYYYDSDGQLLKTAKWTEWSRITSSGDDKTPTPTPTAAPTTAPTQTPAPTSAGGGTQTTTQTQSTTQTAATTGPSSQTTKTTTTKTQTKSPTTKTPTTTRTTSTKTQSTTKSPTTTKSTTSSSTSAGTSTTSNPSSSTSSSASSTTGSSTPKSSATSTPSAGGTDGGTDPAPVTPGAPENAGDGGAPAPVDGTAPADTTGAPAADPNAVVVDQNGGTQPVAANNVPGNGPGAVLAAADTTKYALASETVGSFENTRLAGIGILVALVALGFFCLAFGEVRQQLFGRRRPH